MSGKGSKQFEKGRTVRNLSMLLGGKKLNVVLVSLSLMRLESVCRGIIVSVFVVRDKPV